MKEICCEILWESTSPDMYEIQCDWCDGIFDETLENYEHHLEYCPLCEKRIIFDEVVGT